MPAVQNHPPHIDYTVPGDHSSLENFVLELWGTQPEIAREILTRYCQGAIVQAMQEAKRLMEKSRK